MRHKWTQLPVKYLPKDRAGWFGEMNKVFRRNDHQVVCLMRELDTEWGRVIHCTITQNTLPTWAEKQQIKNELFGPDAQGIEIFPSEKQLVDDADMFHLWVLTEKSIPFGLHPTQWGS